MLEYRKKALAKELITQIASNEYTEAEEDQFLLQLKEIVPDPDISDYIFWSDEFYDENKNLDIDAILEKAFSYKPIAL